MDKMLDSPWFLRLTALFLALLLFYNVQVDQDKNSRNSSVDEVEVIQDLPVEAYYDTENLIVTGVPQTVTMSIEGPSNIVKTAKLFKDFTLYVDLTSLPLGEHEVEIEHENISDKLEARIEPAKITVNIEEKITETFRVEPEFNEGQIAEGYHVAKITVDPETIEVTGAKSVIESINFVKATVSPEANIAESFEEVSIVRVLNQDLNKLDVDISPESVLVKVDIQENAKEVPIVLNEIGTPPEGVVITSIKPDVSRITLSGPNRILNEINEFVVDVDLSKITESGTIEVPLKKPDDIFQLSITKLPIKVEVAEEEVEVDDEEVAEAESTISSQVENIEIVVEGLNDQFKSTFVQPSTGSITLLVKGQANNMNRLKKSDFAVTVDASATVEAGLHQFPIQVTGPPHLEWELSASEATVKIELV